MTNRRGAIVGFGAVVVGLCLTGPLQGTGANYLHTNRLTFSGPVRLPGVTLIAGSYLFERVDPTVRNVIVVRSPDRTRVFFMALTLPAERPSGLRPGAVVTLGEAGRGAVPPIEAWYPQGESQGHAFIYTDR